MITCTPATLVHRHLETVLTQLPGVFDGDTESIHKARIATRRLRETLPLTGGWRIEQMTERVREAGRQLGRVRDLDVMGELLSSLSERVPAAAAIEVHNLRAIVRRRRQEARQVMVKELDNLELPKLRDAFHIGNRMSRLWNRVEGTVAVWTPAWVASIWTQIATRKTEAVAAVERAPGIYLPNRTHAARMAVKKLRYAVEVASDTGVWTPQRVLRDLRKIQGILGNVHDLQVLVDLVDQSQPAEEKPSDSAIVVKNLLTTEIERHHAEYARRRPWIFGIADACERAAARTRWHVSGPIVAASLFTAPLVLESIRTADVDVRDTSDRYGTVV